MGVPDFDSPAGPVKKRQRLSLKAVRQKASPRTQVGNENNNASSKSSPKDSSCRGDYISSETSSSSGSLMTIDSLTPSGSTIDSLTTSASNTDSLTMSASTSSSITYSSSSESKTDTRVPAVASLENFGNTCFMNSVMQVLRYTPGFLDNLAYLFQDIQASEKIKKKNKVDDEVNDTTNFQEENSKKCWKVVKNVYKVYRDLSLLEEKYDEVASDDVMSMAVKPSKVLQTIRDLNPMFEGNLQHDAQEFLRCLLCYLQDAEKDVQKFYTHIPQKFSPKAMLNPIMQKFLQTAKIKNEQKKASAGALQIGIKQEGQIKELKEMEAADCEKVKVNLFTKAEIKTEAVKSPTDGVVVPKVGDTAGAIDGIADSTPPSGAKIEPDIVLSTDLTKEFTFPLEEDVLSGNSALILKTPLVAKAKARRGRKFNPYNSGLSRNSETTSDKSESLQEKGKGSKRGRKKKHVSEIPADIRQPSVSEMFGKTYSNKKRLGMRGAVLKKSAEDLFDEMKEMNKEVSQSSETKTVTDDTTKLESAIIKNETPFSKRNDKSATDIADSVCAKTKGSGSNDNINTVCGKTIEKVKSVSDNKMDQVISERMDTDTNELECDDNSKKLDSQIEFIKGSSLCINKSKSESDICPKAERSLNSQSFQDMFSMFLSRVSTEDDSDSIEMLSDSDSEDIVLQKKIAKKLHESPRKSPRKVASDIIRGSPRRIEKSKLCLSSKSASGVETVKSNLNFSNAQSVAKSSSSKTVDVSVNASPNATPVASLSKSSDISPVVSSSLSTQKCSKGASVTIENSPSANSLKCETDSDFCTIKTEILPRTPVAMDPVVKLENCDHVFGENGTSVSASYAASCLTPIKRSPRKNSSNYLKQRSFLETMDIKNEEDLQHAISEMFNSPVKSRSKYDLTERLFQGTMMLRTRCLQCESLCERQEDFHDVSVPVRIEKTDSDDEDEENTNDSGKCSLLDLIEASTEVEKLLEDNKYYCDECKAYVEAERSLHYDVMPEVLTLHLKRFSAGSRRLGYISKINDPVDIPLKLPCLRYKCPESCLRPDHRYILYAIVTHSGVTLSSGHYLSYVRALPKNKPNPSHAFQSIFDKMSNSQSTTALAEAKAAGSGSTLGKKQPLTRRKTGVAPKLPSRFDENSVTNTKVKAFANVAPKRMKADITETLKTSKRFTAEWFECDDETVRVFDESDFADLLSGEDGSLLGTPYLLFYHKATLC